MTRQVILIGATSGLAAGAIDRLAADGYSLILHGRDADKLAALPHAAATVAGDLADPATLVDQLWTASQGADGEPHGLAVFVGVPFRVPADQWTPAALAEAFAINTAGPLLAVRAWSTRMTDAGLTGNAVVLSTMQAVYPFEGSLPYALSKAALGVGVEVLAKDFGTAVRVNAIAPGVNEAGMALASIGRGKYQPYLDAGTIPRYGQPTDVAGAVSFLLTPDLYMTGQTLLLDGGLTIRRDMR